jgi:hypothetical protein
MKPRAFYKPGRRTIVAACAATVALGAIAVTGCCPRSDLPPTPGTEEWNRLRYMLTVFEETQGGIPAEEYYGAPTPREWSSGAEKP